jgi:hypothetical protein
MIIGYGPIIEPESARPDSTVVPRRLTVAGRTVRTGGPHKRGLFLHRELIYHF